MLTLFVLVTELPHLRGYTHRILYLWLNLGCLEFEKGQSTNQHVTRFNLYSYELNEISLIAARLQVAAIVHIILGRCVFLGFGSLELWAWLVLVLNFGDMDFQFTILIKFKTFDQFISLICSTTFFFFNFSFVFTKVVALVVVYSSSHNGSNKLDIFFYMYIIEPKISRIKVMLLNT